MTPSYTLLGQALARPFNAIDQEIGHSLRKLAMVATLGVVFLRFSMMHEFLAVYASLKFLLYVFTVPALFGLLSGRGIHRILNSFPGKMWLALVLWMFLSVPFSVWPGGAARATLMFLRANLPMLFLIGGLVLTWQECKRTLWTIAFGGMWIVCIQYVIGSSWGGRTGLEFGLVANPNDYAGHLILILPFLVMTAIYPPRIPLLGHLIRPVALAIAGLAAFSVLMSGSRGAMLALAAGCLYAALRAKASIRILLAVMLPIAAVALLFVLPQEIRSRLFNFSSSYVAFDVDPIASDAQNSVNIRKRLLEESLRATISHPVLGVGMDQLANYSGALNLEAGRTGAWMSAHNSYTEISADLGLPGFLFYIGALVSSFLMLEKTRRQLTQHPLYQQDKSYKQCAAIVWFVLISMVSFYVVIAFLNFSFFFYLPAFSGLAIAIQSVVQREFLSKDLPSAQQDLPAMSPLSPMPKISLPAAPAQLPQTAYPRNPVRFGGVRNHRQQL